MSQDLTPEQIAAVYEAAWRSISPYTGEGSVRCPNDGYAMKCSLLRNENPKADLHLYCPRCGKMRIGSDQDPRAGTFRDWTDDEKQELVDRHFRQQRVVCPVDGTTIDTKSSGETVNIHCFRCGRSHYGDLLRRIGTKPLRVDDEDGPELGRTVLDWLSNLTESRTGELVQSDAEVSMKWDLFISHAHEDKKDVAEPLAAAFKERGLKVWYDGFTLAIGDKLRRSIDQGLANSKYGLVILSPHFFQKKWPQKELDGLAALETGKDKKILPVWHNVGHDEVARFSPTLADILGIPTTEGLANIVEQVMTVVKPGERPAAIRLKPAAPPLPSEAVTILKEAAASVTGRILVSVDMDGYRVQAGDFIFGGADANPRMVAKYKGIIRKMDEMGLIAVMDEGLYELTEAGFEVVDSLEDS